jgi:hypothetical protein
MLKPIHFALVILLPLIISCGGAAPTDQNPNPDHPNGPSEADHKLDIIKTYNKALGTTCAAISPAQIDQWSRATEKETMTVIFMATKLDVSYDLCAQLKNVGKTISNKLKDLDINAMTMSSTSCANASSSTNNNGQRSQTKSGGIMATYSMDVSKDKLADLSRELNCVDVDLGSEKIQVRMQLISDIHSKYYYTTLDKEDHIKDMSPMIVEKHFDTLGDKTAFFLNHFAFSSKLTDSVEAFVKEFNPSLSATVDDLIKKQAALNSDSEGGLVSDSTALYMPANARLDLSN